MDKIQAIKERHSVRKYIDKPLPEDVVFELQKEIDEINKESGLNFQLVTNEEKCFSGIMSYGKFVNVKNYIALVGKKSKELDEQIGYYGERVVIKAGQLGLNTCWVALSYSKAHTKAVVKNNEKLVCVISLGYGENQGVQHKFRPIEKIAKLSADDPEWYLSGIELARLAPTAINQQKYYIEREGNNVSISAGVGFYAKVDLGIVKYHFEVGAKKENFEWK